MKQAERSQVISFALSLDRHKHTHPTRGITVRLSRKAGSAQFGLPEGSQVPSTSAA